MSQAIIDVFKAVKVEEHDSKAFLFTFCLINGQAQAVTQ